MKKQIIILWIASFVIVFMAAYIANIIDKDYPITSTFGIDGKKVSYRFEKVHYGKDDFKIIIRTDVAELTGKVFWKNFGEQDWQSKDLKKSNLILFEDIPGLKPEHKLNYYVELYHNDRIFTLPDNHKTNLTLTFFGKIPSTINILEYLLMYLGLILAVRTGLEFFNDGKKSKVFGIFTVVIFLTLIALINPLYLTYKFGFINTSVPPITRLFLWSDIAIFFIWIITLIIIFKTDKFKFLPIVSAGLTIILAVFFR
ncbi:MAG: hypothetical protein IT276_10100 [Ignavibacteriaceae bacterium]|nr:hypothetical protein [Ignavibacteriaceae bacterium]HRN26128.1 hypothetical protein [Ignavibacteriaceae bacterium]HRP92578.1 hypothetical protein [Ignavibacteriaceae bacterium]HRQ53737.1 hypothetical protein [Ignavibacteriaceae bacterium]